MSTVSDLGYGARRSLLRIEGRLRVEGVRGVRLRIMMACGAACLCWLAPETSLVLAQLPGIRKDTRQVLETLADDTPGTVVSSLAGDILTKHNGKEQNNS